MTKDERIEEILQAIHNMVDVEDVKPLLESLYKHGHFDGYQEAQLRYEVRTEDKGR